MRRKQPPPDQPQRLEIIDAEWEDVPEETSPANNESLSSWLWSGARNGVKNIIIAAGAVVIGLLVVGMLTADPSQGGTERPADNDQNAGSATVAPASASSTAPIARDEGSAIIDSCHNLDACGGWRVLSTSVERQRGSERLVKALLRWGDVINPAGNPSDWKHVKWSQRRETFYALCSKQRPSIAFRKVDQWTVSLFDLSNQLPGVEENDANIYGALCHGFFNGELDEVGPKLGYQPLPNGSQQYDIKKPEQLLP